jgi:hypothetical protein
LMLVALKTPLASDQIQQPPPQPPRALLRQWPAGQAAQAQAQAPPPPPGQRPGEGMLWLWRLWSDGIAMSLYGIFMGFFQWDFLGIFKGFNGDSMVISLGDLKKIKPEFSEDNLGRHFLNEKSSTWIIDHINIF